MPDLKQGKECCGCTACSAICPKEAISMKPDSLGFKYPEVDLGKCIECGLCEKVCAFNDHYSTPEDFERPIPYGARLKDLPQVMKSRSGGAFVALSDFILEKGGAVYGAGYRDHFVVAHRRAASASDRDSFRGSKYVQSDLDGIFRQVRQDLKERRWVLFSGTPCQTAALSSFLPKPLKEKLLIVDIVCHGVPAPDIWKDFLTYVEKKEKGRVTEVDFRDKARFGWRDHKETLTLRSDRTGEPKVISGNTYTHLFHQNILLRPSCGECHYCNLRRPSDITLADFWGWERTGSHINDDDKGLSLVLVNTDRGQKIFDLVKDTLDVISPKLEDCMQTHLRQPATLNPLSAEFQNDYSTYGFDYVLKKYGNVGIRHKLRTAGRILKRLASAVIPNLK